MRTNALLTWRLSRFELSAIATSCLIVGIAALIVAARLFAIGVSTECFEAWSVGHSSADCSDLVERFTLVNGEEASKVLAAMAILPFGVGLLAGVPIIAGEIEGRTASTAWWLAASRPVWLMRRSLPVSAALVVCIVFAALGASILQLARSPLSGDGLRDFGLHGPVVIARALTAFGLGVLVGALIGRTLPAFIVGAALAGLLALGLVGAQQSWIAAQPLEVFDQESIEAPGFDAVLYEQGWRDAAGSVVRESAIGSIVPPDHAGDAYAWLISNGFEVVQLGLSARSASVWEFIEICLLSVLTLGMVALAALVTDRRRLA